MRELRDTTARALRRCVIERQSKGRVPGVAAGVVHRGRLAWYDGVGVADLDRPDHAPGPDDQFLIASNTKTFTAVMVMQLRDEGRLSLDDPLERFLPGTAHRGITIRQVLAHSSGMQREPVGDVWESLVMPDREALVKGFDAAERVFAPHHRWHYSNLMFALLGEVVARLDDTDWYAALRRRLLDPLEMRRTTLGFEGAHAQPYFVPPHTDVPVRESAPDLAAMAPAGGLASTPRDMATWSGFIADPDPEILAPDTLDEMCQPQIVMDVDRWGGAMGLGFFLMRSGTRVYVGHTGAMPGHLTGIFTHRESGTGGIVMMNASVCPDPAAFAIELADHVLDHDPEEPEIWRPGTVVPEDLGELVGPWYSEGYPFVFSVREGRLEARAVGLPDHKPSSVFEKVADDVYRTVAGRERGELLRVTRNDAGQVTKLNWATYRVTREAVPFGTPSD
ncbi:serine hydrolase [Pimelobacter sp. 30-1]|uniref:serine hydrolase domain-containing protein n=1 Tax=Pimelobacter sp. 30-1 TaxID=2004991 RepID=UPI001C056464|nr:serine hydrolase domain-containing protein [Pimelobacter sp. 30-1]MBU2698882.1 serine hydrolase [Pimelobacter sp. 30-1]